MTEYRIPRLYETEPIPCDQKIIHQLYYLPEHEGFYWLIAELDPDEGLAFGYACLNDREMAEWGYIPIQELEDVERSWSTDGSPVDSGKQFRGFTEVICNEAAYSLPSMR